MSKCPPQAAVVNQAYIVLNRACDQSHTQQPSIGMILSRFAQPSLKCMDMRETSAF